jgi:hypothetical protein
MKIIKLILRSKQRKRRYFVLTVVTEFIIVTTETHNHCNGIHNRYTTITTDITDLLFVLLSGYNR